MSKSNSIKPQLFILKSNKVYLNFITSSENFIKSNKDSILKKINKWDSNSIIIDSNNFLLLPLELPKYLKKSNIERTLGITDDYKKKTITIKNIKLSHFYNPKSIPNQIKKINNISEVLINEFLNNSIKSQDTYITFMNNKIHICIVNDGELFFYNQFDHSKENYIKFIILISEEFKLDRKKSKINIVNSLIDFRKIKNEMKLYFKNINLYKKSIFKIIEDYYE